MSNQVKVLIILVIVFVGLVTYIIISSKPVTMDLPLASSDASGNQATEKKMAKVDPVELDRSYRSGAKQAVNDFSLLLDSFNNASSSSASERTEDDNEQGEILSEISRLKIDLMEMTVPAEFKDMHLNLVTTLSRMQLSIEEKDYDGAETAGREHLNGLLSEYSWLN